MYSKRRDVIKEKWERINQRLSTNFFGDEANKEELRKNEKQK